VSIWRNEDRGAINSPSRGRSRLGHGRREREGGALRRKADLDMRSIAERLVLRLAAPAERHRRPAGQVVTVSRLVDHPDVFPLDSQRTISTRRDLHFVSASDPINYG